ncbi:MAG: hypothetical protein ABIK20_02390 [Candidatus Omnitrophota bacterium]
MTKQQKEIIIAAALLLIFIGVLIPSLKKIKSSGKARALKPETVLKEEAGKESASVDTPKGLSKEAEETQGKKRDSQIRLIPLIKWRGGWKRDPFTLSQESSLTFRSILKEQESLPGPLTGIVWKEGRPLALIGDYIARTGDTVEDYSVVGIDRNGVTLEKEGRKHQLFLEE